MQRRGSPLNAFHVPSHSWHLVESGDLAPDAYWANHFADMAAGEAAQIAALSEAACLEVAAWDQKAHLVLKRLECVMTAVAALKTPGDDQPRTEGELGLDPPPPDRGRLGDRCWCGQPAPCPATPRLARG